MSGQATNNMGEYLLKGWTMLGDNCPNGCNMPLVRSRDKKHLLCCSCQVDFAESKVQEQSEKVTAETKAEARAQLDIPAVQQSAGASPLKGVLEDKLSWLAKLMQNSSSVSDLKEMVSLAQQIHNFKKDL